MHSEHKKILQTFNNRLDDIHDINMYWGYDGDYILKISTTSVDLVDEIENHCKNNVVQCKVQYDTFATKQYFVFCVAVDGDVYSLKK